MSATPPLGPFSHGGCSGLMSPQLGRLDSSQIITLYKLYTVGGGDEGHEGGRKLVTYHGTYSGRTTVDIL